MYLAKKVGDQFTFTKQTGVLKAEARQKPTVTKPTGAFDPQSEVAGKGLGKLKGVKVTPTAEQLAKIEKHLAQFGEVPENAAMVERIKKALVEGRQLEGADAHFYIHELGEQGLQKFLMEKAGMTREDA